MKGEGCLVEIGRGKIGPWDHSTFYIVVYDIDTGVEYYIIDGRLAPLYNADGSLKTYEGPRG